MILFGLMLPVEDRRLLNHHPTISREVAPMTKPLLVDV